MIFRILLFLILAQFSTAEHKLTAEEANEVILSFPEICGDYGFPDWELVPLRKCGQQVCILPRSVCSYNYNLDSFRCYPVPKRCQERMMDVGDFLSKNNNAFALPDSYFEEGDEEAGVPDENYAPFEEGESVSFGSEDSVPSGSQESTPFGSGETYEIYPDYPLEAETDDDDDDDDSSIPRELPLLPEETLDPPDYPLEAPEPPLSHPDLPEALEEELSKESEDEQDLEEELREWSHRDNNVAAKISLPEETKGKKMAPKNPPPQVFVVPLSRIPDGESKGDWDNCRIMVDTHECRFLRQPQSVLRPNPPKPLAPLFRSQPVIQVGGAGPPQPLPLVPQRPPNPNLHPWLRPQPLAPLRHPGHHGGAVAGPLSPLRAPSSIPVTSVLHKLIQNLRGTGFRVVPIRLLEPVK